MSDRNRSRRVYSFYRAPPSPTAAAASTSGGNVTFLSSSLVGQWIDGGSRSVSAALTASMLSTGSVSISSTSNVDFADTHGTDIFLFVSGTNTSTAGTARTANSRVALLPDTVLSGALYFTNPGATNSPIIYTTVGGIECFANNTGYTRLDGPNGVTSILMNTDNSVLIQNGAAGLIRFADNGATQMVQITSKYPNGWGSFVINPTGAAVGTDVGFFVSGSIGATAGTNRRVAVFGSDVVFSGSVVFSGTTSGVPVINNVTILAGLATVNQSTFQAVAAFEFNPTGAETMAPSGSTTYTAYFQPIIEVFPTGVTLECELFNVTTNSYVAASLLSSTAVTTTRLRSVNLSGSLADGSNVYEMHMRITNAGAGSATCKGAKLFVTWR